MTHHPGPWEFENPKLGTTPPIIGEDRAPKVICWLAGALVSTALFIAAIVRWM